MGLTPTKRGPIETMPMSDPSSHGMKNAVVMDTPIMDNAESSGWVLVMV